jgi:hypothetical protein
MRATETTDQWDGLRPQNVVQAARADIERRKRNELREIGKLDDDPEHYAFLRNHVRDADGAFGLIQCALAAVIKDREHPKPMYSKEVTDKAGKTQLKWFDPSLAGRLRRSTKAHMKHLYSEPLLRAALELEPLEKAW